jgi:hypothetical protein
MDFSKVKIHCSSLGVLFIEPKDATAKKNGDLSETAKKHLIKVYAEMYWGRRKKLTTKYLEKGTSVEPESIELISLLDDVYYEKNEEERENEWIIGTPDVVEEKIQDVKSSFDADTFLPMIISPVEKMYECQMQGYMWLFDKKEALIRRCLVSTPESIVNGERRWLFNKMDVATEENIEYKQAVAELESNHIFEDIPPEERCITHPVPRNEEIIEKIPAKVAKAREFLAYFYEKHMLLNKK